MVKIGSHVSMSGDDMFLASVKEAQSYQATALMVYTGAPQNTRRKAMDQLKVDEALDYMQSIGFDPNNVVVHAPYIMNLANPSEEKRAFAVSFLTEEIKRTAHMNANQIVLHPGSAVGKDRPQAIPIVSFIHRFARQKGLDIIMEVLEDYLKIGAFYFIAIGSGDALYESYFMKLQKKYPEYVYYKEGFDVNLEQKVYAASNLFMLPSLFEPCGLNHMIAMKYGALPIVRETGGLKDTVTPYNKFSGIGVGFTFKNYNKSEFVEAIDQALNLYHEDKEAFNSMVQQAMHIKYSVSKMASQYEELYRKILKS